MFNSLGRFSLGCSLVDSLAFQASFLLLLITSSVFSHFPLLASLSPCSFSSWFHLFSHCLCSYGSISSQLSVCLWVCVCVNVSVLAVVQIQCDSCHVTSGVCPLSPLSPLSCSSFPSSFGYSSVAFISFIFVIFRLSLYGIFYLGLRPFLTGCIMNKWHENTNVWIKSLHTNCDTNLWQKHRETI